MPCCKGSKTGDDLPPVNPRNLPPTRAPHHGHHKSHSASHHKKKTTGNESGKSSSLHVTLMDDAQRKIASANDNGVTTNASLSPVYTPPTPADVAKPVQTEDAPTKKVTDEPDGTTSALPNVARISERDQNSSVIGVDLVNVTLPETTDIAPALGGASTSASADAEAGAGAEAGAEASAGAGAGVGGGDTDITDTHDDDDQSFHSGTSSSDSDDGFHTPPEYTITPLIDVMAAQIEGKSFGSSNRMSVTQPGGVDEEQDEVQSDARVLDDSFFLSEQPTSGLHNVKLMRMDGAQTNLASVLAGRRVLLVFLRHFGCMFCSKVGNMIRQVYDDVVAQGVVFVAIGNGSLQEGREWAAKVDFPAELYIDESLESYSALGLRRRGKVGTEVLKASLSAWKEGYRQDIINTSHGDTYQMGGSFLLDEQGNVEYQQKAEHAGQLPDFQAALEAADPLAATLEHMQDGTTRRISGAGGVTSAGADDSSTGASEGLDATDVSEDRVSMIGGKLEAHHHEDVAEMRAQLEAEFPGQTECFNNDYLSSVLSVKDRQFDYAVNKMLKCLRWRAEVEAGPSLWMRPPIIKTLANRSMYWKGYDKFRRPILWIRPLLKDWGSMDKEAEVSAHVAMIEMGLAQLPPGVTTFTLIADAANLGLKQNDPILMKKLTSVVLGGYPDRLGNVCVGPINAMIRIMYRCLQPLLPARLPPKIRLMKNPKKDLLEFLDESQIPEYFSGPAEHDFDNVSGVTADGEETLADDPFHPDALLYRVKKDRELLDALAKESE